MSVRQRVSRVIMSLASAAASRPTFEDIAVRRVGGTAYSVDGDTYVTKDGAADAESERHRWCLPMMLASNR